MNRTWIAGAAFALPLLLIAPAWADVDIAVTNPSFEAPTLDSSNSWYQGVQGWALSPAPSIGTTFAMPWLPAAQSGNQYVWGDYDGFHLFQETGTLSANRWYTFSAWVYPLSTGTNRLSMSIEDVDNGYSYLTVAHYQPTWAPTRKDFNLVANQWNYVQVEFNSAQVPAAVGHRLRIHFEGSRVALDNSRFVDGDPRHYYISSSTGSDANNGRSPSTPWQTFNIVNNIMLYPGERVDLKMDDQWNQELHLTGKGTAGNMITLASYGSGTNSPRITRSNRSVDRCIVWEAPSYVSIVGMDCRNAKLGLYLRYDVNAGNSNVEVLYSYFQDMSDGTLDAANYNYEYAFASGIFLGGHAWTPVEFSTILNGLTIRSCGFRNCDQGFATNWFYPAVYKSRITNLLMEDCVANDCLNGLFGILYVDGGTIRRCSALDGGLGSKYPYIWTGSTLAMLQACKNVTIDDCEFSGAKRGDAADGCGIDFEGNNENCTLTNSVISDNDGPAVLSLNTQGNNTGIAITNCTFFNNSRSPFTSLANSEMQSGTGSNTGSIGNVGMYRRANTVNFLSANWGGFTQTGNRQLEYSSYMALKRWWNFDTAGNFEGWTGFNQWTASVSGGALNGTSTGADPYGYSGATFANSGDNRYAWIRMKSSAGTSAQVFYITDTDTAWNETKSKSFTITADNVYRDYFVDLESANLKGVITGIRLDPTTVSGASYAVDFVRLTWSTDPGQSAPVYPTVPTIATFTSQSANDGYVTESTQASGVGGSNNSSAGTMRIGDTSSKQSTRLILSFDTSSLPDTAVIDKVFLKVMRTGAVGTNPWTWQANNSNPCRVDIRNGDFGGAQALANSDFEAAASATNVGRLLVPYADGLQVWDELNATGNANINKTGRTQFRIRMEQEDNNDAVTDYVDIGTGNNTTAANRPVLEVWYR